jgi:hypothetical protein
MRETVLPVVSLGKSKRGNPHGHHFGMPKQSRKLALSIQFFQSFTPHSVDVEIRASPWRVKVCGAEKGFNGVF